jgi:ArsR family transcriptional regulator, lead/cadmium/zinc/bismuth-responsive transcriptional repressor
MGLNKLKQMRERGVFYHLAETFQALGDSSRVQIVWALMQGEQNVGELAKFLDMSQPAVSHHLRTLRNLRLVSIRKSGRTSFYSLDDEHISHLILEGLRHVEEFT